MSARHTRRGFLAAHHLAAKAGIPVPPHVAAGPTAEDPQAGGGQDRPWYRISNASDDEAELLLYDDIGGWFGTYAEDFDADLKNVTAKKLTVRVNSPGGSVFEGMAIASMLRAHPADITVRVDGIAASIASVIAMAGDRVVMMPGSTLMIHDASGMCLGDAADMAKMAELLDLLSNNIADIYAAKAGGTRDEWRTTMRAEKWYLAQEAVDAGLADEVASMDRPEQDAPEMRRAWDLKAYGYAGPDLTAHVGDGNAQAGMQPVTVQVHLDGKQIAEHLTDVIRASARQSVGAEPPAVSDTASGVHHTATENSAWDGPGAVSSMPNDKAVLRYCHAWYDPDGDPEAKSSYKFPHHRKEGGPANLAACRNGLARLDSADIPDGERDGVRKHLQAHLDDAKTTDDAADTEPAAATALDDWAADVAPLFTDPADDWAADLTHLIGPDASSSAATAHA